MIRQIEKRQIFRSGVYKGDTEMEYNDEEGKEKWKEIRKGGYVMKPT